MAGIGKIQRNGELVHPRFAERPIALQRHERAVGNQDSVGKEGIDLDGPNHIEQVVPEERLAAGQLDHRRVELVDEFPEALRFHAFLVRAVALDVAMPAVGVAGEGGLKGDDHRAARKKVPRPVPDQLRRVFHRDMGHDTSFQLTNKMSL